jgi:hypothetical protein
VGTRHEVRRRGRLVRRLLTGTNLRPLKQYLTRQPRPSDGTRVACGASRFAHNNWISIMHRRVACMMLVAITTSVFVVIGCGDSHPPVDSSLTEATVKGVIKLKGKPAVGGGRVMFNPSNVERKVAAATAEIKEDGSFFLKTYTGGNEVKFSGPFISEERGLALTTRYCELEPGENIINFDLLGENDRARGAIYSDIAKKGARRRK